jgi:hypothetical protein
LRAGVDNAWSRKDFCLGGGLLYRAELPPRLGSLLMGSSLVVDILVGGVYLFHSPCGEESPVGRGRRSPSKRRERALDTVRETGPLLTCNGFQLKSSCPILCSSQPHFSDTNMGSCWLGAYSRRGCPRAGALRLGSLQPNPEWSRLCLATG